MTSTSRENCSNPAPRGVSASTPLAVGSPFESASAPSLLESSFAGLPPEQLRAALQGFLPASASASERLAMIEAALRTPAGQQLRQAMAKWIVHQLVPAERLVPKEYAQWRPPVQDAMTFVVSHLSAARLAPKLLQQLELPANTSAEERLLRLISEVPGLQKLGQVLARNRHLRPALRRALAKLENGIRDVNADEINAIVRVQLRARLQRYQVQLVPALLSEASVSAVARFTWRNPDTGQRERGVFKVMKPHIPACFAEDMDLLQALAHYFGGRHREYRFPAQLIPDTFKKVRRLLQHEVNFTREQKTLLEAAKLYAGVSGVRVPRLIRPLCTPTITAITEEHGVKVTNAAARLPARARRRIADQLLEALIAIPLFAAEPEAIFHADPHAGNLLYDSRRGELIIIDWALRERLSRRQRRHLALLFLMVSLRDPVGAGRQVEALAERPIRRDSRQAAVIRSAVTQFLDELPLKRLPSAADAMRLLERVAVKGIRFPASLVMLSKVLFTLDGILEDIAGSEAGMGFTLARHVAQRWIAHPAAFRSPLTAQDWLSVQCSALLCGSRVWVRWEQALLDRLVPRVVVATAAPR